MSYLLKCTDRHGTAVYVAPPGSPNSYVTKSKARVYLTRAEADADRCPENEIIVHRNLTR